LTMIWLGTPANLYCFIVNLMLTAKGIPSSCQN
jgi:hypothetical protein